MIKAICEDEVVSILKSKYLPLTVIYILFVKYVSGYLILFCFRMCKSKMVNTINQNFIIY